MADYSGYTLAQVEAALRPGQPGTLAEAASLFAGAQQALRALLEEIPAAMGTVTHTWTGPAADAFTKVVQDFLGYLQVLADQLNPYRPALVQSGQSLTEAQQTLAAFLAEVAEYREQALAVGVAPDEASIDAQARQIIERLAAVYVSVVAQLIPIPESPQDPVAQPVAESSVAPAGTLVNRTALLTAVAAEYTAGVPMVLGKAPAVPSLLFDTTTTDGAPGDPPELGGAPGGAYLGLRGPAPDAPTVLAGFTGHLPAAPTTPIAHSVLPAAPEVFGGGGPLTGGFTGLTGFGLRAPATRVTRAGRTPAPASPTPSATGSPGMPPHSPLYGHPVSTLGRPGDEEETERETELVGDQEWDEGHGFTGAIGRKP